MDLLDLFKEEAKIPSLPEVFYRFKEAVADPDTSFEDLSEIVSCDAGLTAHLLKIVNSPFFGFSDQIETIPHAISIIGSDQLNDLVLSTSVIERFKIVSPEAMDIQLFWQHSIACGLAAKNIAKRLKMLNPDSIFVGGLLHDIGRLVICINVPQFFNEIFLKAKTENKSLLVAEQEFLGFGHDEVGGELLKRWKLPKIHEESVRYHHQPQNASLFEKEASVINVANHIVNSLALGCGEELLTEEIKKESLEILGNKEEQTFLDIKEELLEQCQNTIQAFLH